MRHVHTCTRRTIARALGLMIRHDGSSIPGRFGLLSSMHTVQNGMLIPVIQININTNCRGYCAEGRIGRLVERCRRNAVAVSGVKIDEV